MEEPILKLMNLIFSDEPFKALEYVKTLEGPTYRNIQKKIEEKLDHITNYEVYMEKYRDDPMNWKPENAWGERYQWLFENIMQSKPKSFIDLGCYEGSVVLKVAQHLKIPSVGVEINKVAVEWNNSRVPKGVDAKFIQSSIEEFETDEKYDAVSCMEVIEHVKDPKKITDKMKSLMHKDSYGFITTPNGTLDTPNTIRIWETPGAYFDHVRIYTPESLAKDIDSDRIVIYEKGSSLLAIFQLPTGDKK